MCATLMDRFEDESVVVSTGVSAEEEARKRAQAQEREAKFSCRFYENQYPEVEEVVIVNVKNIAEMGAYVSLLEYEGIEGMILLSELSRRRIRSIPKLIRVGKNEAVMVLRVDKEKGPCPPAHAAAAGTAARPALTPRRRGRDRRIH